MGLAPKHSIFRDLICVPPGFSAPVVLRELRGNDPPGYVAVGEAYLDGFMYGKAIEIMEKGELRA
jgi:hypothetical protein